MRTKHFLAPVGRERNFTGTVRMRHPGPYSKDLARDTPQVESDWLLEGAERQLHTHYGIQALGISLRDPIDRGTYVGILSHHRWGASVARHEEEMRVGKREVEYGGVRLRNWMEPQPVSEQVTLHRETAHVECEAVNCPAGAR